MKCLVVVAHPDDEVIWMGGTILRHPSWEWHVLSLCRAGDSDREPRFHAAAREMGTHEYIADLDDSPMLAPLSEDLIEIKQRVRKLPELAYDLVFTHGFSGEYTYHLRHEQTHRAVRTMVHADEVQGTLLTFAYHDCLGACSPRPADDADIRLTLGPSEFDRKVSILRGIYNFGPGSFELEAAGPVEAFNVDGDEALLENARQALEA